jgi:hypothetical protein
MSAAPQTAQSALMQQIVQSVGVEVRASLAPILDQLAAIQASMNALSMRDAGQPPRARAAPHAPHTPSAAGEVPGDAGRAQSINIWYASSMAQGNPPRLREEALELLADACGSNAPFTKKYPPPDLGHDRRAGAAAWVDSVPEAKRSEFWRAAAGVIWKTLGPEAKADLKAVRAEQDKAALVLQPQLELDRSVEGF